MTELVVTPVGGLPPIGAGDDLGALIGGAIELVAGDVVVVAQKVVSKAEGRVLDLATVQPRAEAVEIAGAQEDPRFVEVVLRESVRVVRRRGSLLICETRHGLVCASAGVDRSNAPGADLVVLLPLDPDASAERLRAALPDGVAVLVSDSLGRPFRLGITGVAIGSAGIEPLDDRIGRPDDAGRPFAGTIVHVADELAAIADHVMGPAGGVPAVRIRGARVTGGGKGAAATAMPADRDLFR
ncbi:MAG: coenzyme F420-0:L-glutamate ligase / coenzyme F420:gamma-L-glutamate ligase [Gaiellaceae bacterium]|jgi:coenzyme F420-0:L-glutamate ligase/coenzyme F420-1:gamma-L-glutamate ligase|nr:coenzyme F420-0:L-glutamate ligase / coenzyme F420:gamma-L-glutamate ligase [Gaiellaceae bacterium]